MDKRTSLVDSLPAVGGMWSSVLYGYMYTRARSILLARDTNYGLYQYCHSHPVVAYDYQRRISLLIGNQRNTE